LQITHRDRGAAHSLSVAWTAERRAGARARIRFSAKLSAAWLALILVQATLGAATI